MPVAAQAWKLVDVGRRTGRRRSSLLVVVRRRWLLIGRLLLVCRLLLVRRLLLVCRLLLIGRGLLVGRRLLVGRLVLIVGRLSLHIVARAVSMNVSRTHCHEIVTPPLLANNDTGLQGGRCTLAYGADAVLQFKLALMFEESL